MKVLIDECAPKALKTFLTKHGHETLTVQEAGWAGKQNGELLKLDLPALVSTVSCGLSASFLNRLQSRLPFSCPYHAAAHR